MNTIKPTKIIESFNLHEQKAFDSYLQSGYFTTDKTLIKLYAQLKKQGDAITETQLFKSMYPGKKVSVAKLRHQLSALTKHAEYFLTIRHLDKNPTLLRTLNTKALAAKNCSKAYDYVYSELHRKSTLQNSSELYHFFEASETHINYEATRQSRKLKLDFSNVFHYLDSFYIAKKLQLFCEVTNLKNILSGEYNLHLFEEIKLLALHDEFKKTPVILIYYHILLTLTEPQDEKHFDKLQRLVALHHALFPVTELKDLYQYIKNYCVKKINGGEWNYNKILLNIYKQMLSDKRLMYHDYFSQWEFKNVVSISLRINEKEWCRNFIHKYINYLPPAERKNALTFNLAHLNFTNGNFKIAIRMLRDVEFTDVFYKIDARVILLKCYYELNDYDAYFYHSSAFRLFLLRNRQISMYQKRFNRNLIVFLNKLVRAEGKMSGLKKLKHEVLQEKNISDINWLTEKINLALMKTSRK